MGKLAKIRGDKATVEDADITHLPNINNAESR